MGGERHDTHASTAAPSACNNVGLSVLSNHPILMVLLVDGQIHKRVEVNVRIALNKVQ
jgi:hypothetical protein